MTGVGEHLRFVANPGRIGVACTTKLRGFAGGSLRRQRTGEDAYSPSLSAPINGSINGRCILGALPLIAVASITVARPKIDGSPERAKTDLNPELKQIGTITPRSADKVLAQTGRYKATQENLIAEKLLAFSKCL